MPLIRATAVHYAGREKRPKIQVALEKQSFKIIKCLVALFIENSCIFPVESNYLFKVSDTRNLYGI